MSKVYISLETTLYKIDNHIFSISFLQMGNGHIRFFPKTARNKQFIMVAVDYIIKWVEAKTLIDITTNKVISFLWKNITCKFGIPKILITNNEFYHEWAFESNVHKNLTPYIISRILSWYKTWMILSNKLFPTLSV